MDEERIKELESLQKKLNYCFNDIELLDTALTHSSYANEHNLHISKCNERLEFLGDTVVNIVVSQYLYKKYTFYPEGELTKIRAKVVCEHSLALVARSIDLGKYLLLGKGEDATGGRDRESILGNASEAIAGAIFVDSDFNTVNNLLLANFEADIVHAVAKGSLFVDYKTELQEKLQRVTKGTIEYVLIKEEGPDHNKLFYIDVTSNKETIGSGVGRNKKEAEQMAAKEALILLADDYE